jgi:hypothetical protein
MWWDLEQLINTTSCICGPDLVLLDAGCSVQVKKVEIDNLDSIIIFVEFEWAFLHRMDIAYIL